MASRDEKAPQRPESGADEEFLVEYRESRSEYGRFNLLITGKSGVGKSSLINAVFGRDLARVGMGVPITEQLSYYHDSSLGIWDTEGFELGEAEHPTDKVRAALKEIGSRPLLEQVSVVWYCVDAGSKRLLPTEIQVIQELANAGYPVILVVTKTTWTKRTLSRRNEIAEVDEEFVNWLKNPVDERTGVPIDLPVRDVIATSAVGNDGKGVGHGISDLVSRTLVESPEDQKDAFKIAQRLNLPWKREMARIAIAQASALSATAAAVPLPVTDAATLAPIQLAMMGRISTIYDLEIRTMLSAGALAQMSVEVTGKALARSFIKLIPGVGSAVNAAVASALTAAAGEAWMRLCEKAYQGNLPIGGLDKIAGQISPNVLTVFKELALSRAQK